MLIDIINNQKIRKISKINTKKFIKDIFKEISNDLLIIKKNIKEIEFSIQFSDDKFIHDLNKNYRKKDKPTDVLTFFQYDKIDENVLNFFLGDIIISIETLINQAVEYEEEENYTIKRLLVHGILHLIGFDHEKDNGEMLKLQDELLEKVNFEGGLIV